MDLEYVTTKELTEKSDVYSYGVVLLELLTGRRVIQDNKNLVESFEVFLASESRITELVDPNIGDGYDFDQLQTIVAIIRWCTEREGRTRPSIKRVLRLLYESTDPLRGDCVEAVEGEETGSRGRNNRGNNMFFSGDGKRPPSSTSRSYYSRAFLLETSPLSRQTIFPLFKVYVSRLSVCF